MSIVPIYDLHTHTVYSHGKGTVEENVQAAIKKGLKRIAITEHAPAHVFFGVRSERLRSLRKETDMLASRYCRDIEILMGLECNLTGFGLCDAPENDTMCDIKLLAYHKGVFPRDSLVWRAACESFGMGHTDPVRLSNALLAAAERYRINIFSHPSLYARCDIDVLSKGAAQLNVLLELNAHHVTLTDDEITLAAKNKARFSINSDAHRPDDVGRLDVAIDAAQRTNVLDKTLGFGFLEM